MRLGLLRILHHWIARVIGPVELGQVCLAGDKDCNAYLRADFKRKWCKEVGLLPFKETRDLTYSVYDVAFWTSDYNTETFACCPHGYNIFFEMPDHPGDHWSNYEWDSVDLKEKLCCNWEEIDRQLEEQATRSGLSRYHAL